MQLSLLVSCLGALALIPAAAVEWLRLSPRWREPTLALAVLATLALSLWPEFGGSFAKALWSSLAMCLLLYWLAGRINTPVRRLAPLILGYCVIGGLLAVPFAEPVPAARWTGPALLHIVPGLAGYGLITLAAVAGLAGDLQARALRSRRSGWLIDRLPSLQLCEALCFRFLAGAVASLSVAVFAGMALNWAQHLPLIRPDHKSLLTLVALAVTSGFLLAHYLSGLRGRQAVRWALASYLILTIAFLGAKFVADIVLGRG